MTSDYRRDHAFALKNDELNALKTAAQLDISATVAAFASLYPSPTASNGETLALKRAFARYLIDSGKASTAGVLV